VAGQVTQVAEESLTLVGSEQLLAKGLPSDATPSGRSTLPAGHFRLLVAAGVSHDEPAEGLPAGGAAPAGEFFFEWGITDRLQLSDFSLAYRLGDRGGVEWIPWGGFTSFGPGLASQTGLYFHYELGAGLDNHVWLGPWSRLNFCLSTFSNEARLGDPGWPRSPIAWYARLSAGYAYDVGNVVTLSAGVSVTSSYLYDGKFPGSQGFVEVGLGSVQTNAGRRIPLVSVHLPRGISLDAYAAVYFYSGTIEEDYLGGVSWTF
jgi:hypothetical protein